MLSSNERDKVMDYRDEEIIVTMHQESFREYFGTPFQGYFPSKYKYPLSQYHNYLFVEPYDNVFRSYVFCAMGQDKYAAGWTLLSEGLGKWSIEDVTGGPTSFRYMSLDLYGEMCYGNADPAEFVNTLVVKKEEDDDGDEDAVQFDFRFQMTLRGPLNEPWVEEYHATFPDYEVLSILQYLFYELEEPICIIPSDSCVKYWFSKGMSIVSEDAIRKDASLQALLCLVDDSCSGEDLLSLYKDLPRLPEGMALSKFLTEWMNRNCSEDRENTSDIAQALWLLQGRSKRIYDLCLAQDNFTKSQIEQVFDKLLNTEMDIEKISPGPAIRSPKYRKFQENKEMLVRELKWYLNSDS